MKRLSMLVFVFVLTASISFAADIKVSAPAIPATPAVKKPTVASSVELIDINSATEAELKAIPFVGDTFAKKVMAGRPFSNKSQLLSKKIVPKPVYDKIKDMIIAKKAK